MKTRLIFPLLALIFFPSTVLAVSLVCDAPTVTVSGCEVEIVRAGQPAVVQSGICTISDNTYYLLNLDSLQTGPYVFRARFLGEGGWPGPWSNPFSASKPGGPSGVAIE